ncbi:MAG TPA: hypothetical protein VFH83_08085, partial [Spirochaetia bacterium]|nr:hypothetical protein [Spirochaetia bacterium]
VLAASLVLVSLGGCAPSKYKPTANEEIYGTWTNPGAAHQKSVFSANGTWQQFTYAEDTAPSASGTFEIARKWKDPDGTIWYHENFERTTGVYQFKGQQLVRIDKSGKQIETMYVEVPKFDPANYPKKLDPKSESYGIAYR